MNIRPLQRNSSSYQEITFKAVANLTIALTAIAAFAALVQQAQDKTINFHPVVIGVSFQNTLLTIQHTIRTIWPGRLDISKNSTFENISIGLVKLCLMTTLVTLATSRVKNDSLEIGSEATVIALTAILPFFLLLEHPSIKRAVITNLALFFQAAVIGAAISERLYVPQTCTEVFRQNWKNWTHSEPGHCLISANHTPFELAYHSELHNNKGPIPNKILGFEYVKIHLPFPEKGPIAFIPLSSIDELPQSLKELQDLVGPLDANIELAHSKDGQVRIGVQGNGYWKTVQNPCRTSCKECYLHLFEKCLSKEALNYLKSFWNR